MSTVTTTPSYPEVQVAVYRKLMERRSSDSNFTFSVRRSSFKDAVNKGLFIGTKTSNYFAFTLWGIPVSDGSATGDLLDYCVGWNRDGTLRTYLHYQLATNASGDQNAGNLAFGAALQQQAIAWDVSNPTAAVLRLTYTSATNLTTVDAVTNALLALITETLPLVDAAIAATHTSHPGWYAERISQSEFETNRVRMEEKRADWLSGNAPTGGTTTGGTTGIVPKAEQGVAKFPLNQILYGPPGTGKTYHTIARAVALLEGLSDEALAVQYPPDKREDLRKKFKDYREAQRIEFVTFHQAFSYEDFIEGIKPLPPAKEDDTTGTATIAKPVQYDVVPGVFRRICNAATAAANPTAVPAPPAFDELYDGFVAQLQQRMTSTNGPLTFSSKTGEPMTLTEINASKAGRLTFLHANSAQQDHHIDKMWVQKLYEKYPSIDLIKHLRKDITDTIGGSNATLQWVVFNELKKYEAAWVAQEREKQKSKPAPAFVLIIDEINRGNIANIFGELITLLEDDKRTGAAESLTVTLPYSKEDFSVPQNLYILGTMNTADRSVEALDTALRRRFSFTEMLPQPKLLPEDVEGINLREMLTAINVRLEQLLDHDHCIGHALLIHVTSLDQLREAFRRSILPLLQEYFFGDWGKIGLVLGSSFIQQVNKASSTPIYKLLAFNSYSTSELSEKPVYKLANVKKLEAKAFQDIYLS